MRVWPELSPNFAVSHCPLSLSSLGALGHHDEQLLRLSAEHLPTLLKDMAPKGLSEMAAAFSRARLWIPSALDALSGEAAVKAELFEPTHAAVLLAALGQMRWDHAAAVSALVARLQMCIEEEMHWTAHNASSYLANVALAMRGQA